MCDDDWWGEEVECGLPDEFWVAIVIWGLLIMVNAFVAICVTKWGLDATKKRSNQIQEKKKDKKKAKKAAEQQAQAMQMAQMVQMAQMQPGQQQIGQMQMMQQPG